jgi:hypothetical protein
VTLLRTPELFKLQRVAKSLTTIPTERIDGAIFFIRGEKIMLDRDLAPLQRIYDCIQPSGQAPQGKISGRLYVSADNGGSSSLADRRIEESSKITEVGGPLPQALVARASTSSRHLMCLPGGF